MAGTEARTAATAAQAALRLLLLLHQRRQNAGTGNRPGLPSTPGRSDEKCDVLGFGKQAEYGARTGNVGNVGE